VHDVVQSVATAFSRALDYRGRSTRAEYWWFTLFALVVNATAAAADGLAMQPEGM
jgi:uncharacterized membrane protein YhaH (DUF805 family)